jgi:hypothetical protein
MYFANDRKETDTTIDLPAAARRYPAFMAAESGGFPIGDMDRWIASKTAAV